MCPTCIVPYPKDDSVAILRMNFRPVNAFNSRMLAALLEALDSVERDPRYKVLVLTSGIPRVFSAGLDLKEMYQTTEERHRLFWTLLQKMFIRFYTSPLVTISLINGECPAAGCLISMACDHRLMLRGHRIGLNETRLGIVAPWWFIAPFKTLVGQREAEKHLQLGTMLSADNALQLGLVDAVAETEPELYDHVNDIVTEWTKVHQNARSKTKHLMRQELADRLSKDAEDDWRATWNHVSSESVQKSLGSCIAILSQKGTRAKL